MGIVQLLKELFETIFLSSSPETQKKQQLRKIESELRNIQPVIFKSDLVQPAFAEAIRLLYLHTKPLADLFAETITSEDVKRNDKFLDKLVISGFSPEEQIQLEELNYENRRAAVSEPDVTPAKIFEHQRRTLGKLISQLNAQEFLKIDVVLADLMQLSDFCRFNFMSILSIFDNNFSGLIAGYTPSFQPVDPKSLEKSLCDLYYLSANLKITQSVARAILALIQIKKGEEPSAQEEKEILHHLKSILYILNHIVTASNLKNLISIGQGNPAANPTMALYKSSARQKFSSRFQEYFDADERRIKQELKDQTTNSELQALFGEHPMESLVGYNTELNNTLRNNSSFSLSWVRPLEIIKTFLKVYYSEPIKALLNDIVIEGFFNNPNYKTEFSSTVYACAASLEHITSFEKEFGEKGKYNVEMINGYIRDSHKNSEFTKQLEDLIDEMNDEAKSIMVTETTALFTLFDTLGDILVDAKKAKNEIIDNLKVLFMSSRNRDCSDLLERQYPSWGIFFDVMKNYAIINLKSPQKSSS